MDGWIQLARSSFAYISISMLVGSWRSTQPKRDVKSSCVRLFLCLCVVRGSWCFPIFHKSHCWIGGLGAVGHKSKHLIKREMTVGNTVISNWHEIVLPSNYFSPVVRHVSYLLSRHRQRSSHGPTKTTKNICERRRIWTKINKYSAERIFDRSVCVILTLIARATLIIICERIKIDSKAFKCEINAVSITPCLNPIYLFSCYLIYT